MGATPPHRPPVLGRAPGLAALVAVALPFVAMAADPPPGRQAQAARHLEAGYQAYRLGEYPQAIEAFERAYGIDPQPLLLLNIGAAYEIWGGHCREALGAFERFFQICDGCAEAADARARRQSLEARCVVEVSIVTRPPGARLEIDGEDRGRSPLRLRLPAGRYQLSARLDDRPAVERSFTLRERQPERLDVALRPATPSQALPWAVASVAAISAGVGAGFLVAAQASAETEDAALARYHDARTTAAAAAAKIDLGAARDEGAGRQITGWVLLGTGAALGGLATWLFLASAEDRAGVGPGVGPGVVVIDGGAVVSWGAAW